MKLSASKLRQDIYRILDGVLRTGKPVEIERHGKTLRIVADGVVYRKLRNLRKRTLTDEAPETFTHIDWSKEWKGRR